MTRVRGPGRIVGAIGTQNASLLIALGILVAIFGSLRPDVFFLPRNIQNIGQAIAILGVLATAQTIVIVSGALDISVGRSSGCRRCASRSAYREPVRRPSAPCSDSWWAGSPDWSTA